MNRKHSTTQSRKTVPWALTSDTNVSFAKGGEVLEGVKLLLMLFGRGVRVVRGWGILVLGDEGV